MAATLVRKPHGVLWVAVVRPVKDRSGGSSRFGHRLQPKEGGDKRDCKRRAVHRPFAMVLLRWAPKTFGLGRDKGLCAPKRVVCEQEPQTNGKKAHTRQPCASFGLLCIACKARQAQQARRGAGCEEGGAGSAARLGHQLGQGGGLLQRR